MWVVVWERGGHYSLFADWRKALSVACEVAARRGARPRVLSETTWRKATG